MPEPRITHTQTHMPEPSIRHTHTHTHMPEPSLRHTHICQSPTYTHTQNPTFCNIHQLTHTHINTNFSPLLARDPQLRSSKSINCSVNIFKAIQMSTATDNSVDVYLSSCWKHFKWPINAPLIQHDEVE